MAEESHSGWIALLLVCQSMTGLGEPSRMCAGTFRDMSQPHVIQGKFLFVINWNKIMSLSVGKNVESKEEAMSHSALN